MIYARYFPALSLGHTKLYTRMWGLERDRILELDTQNMGEGFEGMKPKESMSKKELEIFYCWKEHGRPVMDEAYRQKLLSDPNWKNDPIWNAVANESNGASGTTKSDGSQTASTTKEQPAIAGQAETNQEAAQAIEQPEAQRETAPSPDTRIVEQPEANKETTSSPGQVQTQHHHRPQTSQPRLPKGQQSECQKKHLR